MNSGTLVAFIGLSLICLYILIKILNFYGIGQDVYGIYLSFFLFLLVTSLILPRCYAKI